VSSDTNDGRSNRSWGSKMALACLSFLLTLAALEAGFRWRAHIQNGMALDEAIRTAPEITPGSEVPMRAFLQLCANERIVYELRPDVSARFLGQPFTINAAGLRGPSHPVEKPAGTSRIVGIGDSYLYGWGLPDGQDCLSQLVALLGRNFPSQRWEGINTGVPGYTTVQEIETLAAKGLAYDPDIVLLAMVSNDLRLPKFLDESDPFDFGRSFLLQALAGADEDTGPGPDKIDAFFLPSDEISQGEDHGRSARWEAFTAGLDRLKAMAQRDDFEVVVAYLTPRPRKWKADALKLCADMGFHVVDVGVTYQAYAQERGVTDIADAGLTIGADDPHPSALANAIAAREILTLLEGAGALKPGQPASHTSDR
jgi:hypothetical protein